MKIEGMNLPDQWKNASATTEDCMNGGHCTNPNTCTCTVHWEEHDCTTG